MTALSARCTATAKRSGQRCQQMVIGGGVCFKHGGNAPAVKRKRLERVALAEALARDPRRSPAEVLAAAGHQADWLWRQAQESVKAGAPTAELLEVVARGEMAARLAKVSLDAQVDDRHARVAEVQATLLAGAVSRILDRMELTAEQRALVPVVVPEELERLSIMGGAGADE